MNEVLPLLALVDPGDLLSLLLLVPWYCVTLRQRYTPVRPLSSRRSQVVTARRSGKRVSLFASAVFGVGLYKSGEEVLTRINTRDTQGLSSSFHPPHFTPTSRPPINKPINHNVLHHPHRKLIHLFCLTLTIPSPCSATRTTTSTA